MLRIEDTDLARNTPEGYHSIIDSLNWLGIDWDEGPEVGGDNGPYRQSERFPIYAEAARALREARAAYDCYCTPEEVDARRKESGSAEPGVRRVLPRARCRPAGRLAGAGPNAGAAVPHAVGADRVRRPRTRHRDLPARERPGLRDPARERRPALHPGEPARRRDDGHHPRAARRGPPVVDPASDPALPDPPAPRSRQRPAALRSPSDGDGRGQPQAVQARPGLRAAGLRRPRLPARGSAQLPRAPGLGHRRGPRRLHHAGDGGGVRHRAGSTRTPPAST